jgi:putative alpha-1,2-mannosidase
MEYAQLRADYDRAFAELCSAQASVNRGTGDALRLERACEAYHACRERLAGFLASREAVGHGQDDVRRLAHRLWEQAGRPEGQAEQHWYRAEALVRAAQQ